ncbi:hypothetical protein [Lewinella sp. LCG006]|uniref:hypothetical protein n=1 Tax=Lewinella sp. LCG006 TaxID=3231911 RepID=UPI003460012A
MEKITKLVVQAYTTPAGLLGVLIIILLSGSGCENNRFEITQSSGSKASQEQRSYLQEGPGKDCLQSYFQSYQSVEIRFPEDTLQYSVYKDNIQSYLIAKGVKVTYQDTTGKVITKVVQVNLFPDENKGCEVEATESQVQENHPATGSTQRNTKTPVAPVTPKATPKPPREKSAAERIKM